MEESQVPQPMAFDRVIEHAIVMFVNSEAEKLDIDADKFIVSISFNKAGEVFFKTLIDNKWNPEPDPEKQTTRLFQIEDVTAFLQANVPLEGIVKEALQKFATKEALSKQVGIEQLKLMIKFKAIIPPEGDPYAEVKYATFIDGKWEKNGRTRSFTLQEVLDVYENEDDEEEKED